MELCARIKAVLRRTYGDRPQRYSFGTVEVDFDRGMARRGKSAVSLTALEFKVLAALIQSRGRFLSRDRLIELVWGHGVSITDRVVDNHIMNLRRKLEDSPTKPRYIVSVRGLGYCFENPEAEENV
jgi:DNA-binding response OmpR family regulator